MTTKELIRAEIRKWQSIVEERCPESKRSRDYTKEEWDAIYEYNDYTRILSFLDTLPDECVANTSKTFSEDLEEAAVEYATTHLRNNEFPTVDSAFRAGAEWQKAKMMDDAYEEEVQEVYRDDDGIHCCVSVGTDYKPGAIVYVITIPKEDAE